ncbi:MarR family winged helix-turn-helix transcriptional regulator [Algoriphagus terrigena]|uniref:MarR family winged helix-turn-helix transcriptional regulator n=1 Tax=Algoriphagus terrigena TaxID=344884 RepID=UPI00041DF047|nr:MarR family transcriptional regulator [Algoriphagus terrigena]
MANSKHPTIQLSKALYTSSRLLIQQIQTHLNEFGLTYPQFLALSILWEEDGLKVHELGNRMSLDSGTLTPLLKKLESQNLLKRKRGEADERTVTINLTYPGKSLQSKVMGSISTMEEDFASRMGKQTDELLSAAGEYLEKLKSIKS